jgi:predicted dinucleotide-utilizing enzyme
MNPRLTILGGIATLLTAIIGTTIAVDSRYAKSAEVKDQFCAARKQTLRDRIFELDLKPERSASDKALREYLQQQLNDGCTS